MGSLKNTIIKHLKKVKYRLTSFLLFIKEKLNFNSANNINSHQIQLDKKLIYSLSKSKIPKFKQIKYIKKFLNSKEIIIINICLIVITINLTLLGVQFYKKHLKIIPAKGGEYIEGIIGTPKYINPLYASANDVDSDINKLIFSSLFKRDKNNQLVNDLTKNYELKEENKAYIIKLRTDVKWHNDTLLTVEDIIFTFNAIKNNHYKSPLRSSFLGVDIIKIDNETIKFILGEPYAAFLELLTFGIIPKEPWSQINPSSANLAELNLKPIGSGPYKFKTLLKDKSGNIKSYSIILNDEYYDKKPYIEKITYKFFINIEEIIASMNKNEIDGISYTPINTIDNLIAQDSLQFHKLGTPQITTIFLNQENNISLADKKIRKALLLAINKNEIISNIFSDEAKVVNGPILQSNFAYNHNLKIIKFNIKEAKKNLDESDWKEIEITDEIIIKAEKNKESKKEKIKTKALDELELGKGKWRIKNDKYLKIYLTTVETNENIKVVNNIKKYWEKIGIKTIITIVPTNEIQEKIITPRNFEALLYGQIIGNDPDSYAFWHSSQIGINGLNISNYSNKKIDKLLEDARLTSDKKIRIEKYKEFQEIINEEIPAIFIYSPMYTYIQNKKIKGFNVNNIVLPCDRFNNISDWYIKTGKKIIW